MGNRPKNSPENDIHAKQESIPPFLGIVGDKKWSPFLDLGIPSPIFLHPKSLKMAVFGCKKVGLWMPKMLFASLSIQVDIKVENDVCFYFDADAFSAD